jgi:ribose transport system permease protein
MSGLLTRVRAGLPAGRALRFTTIVRLSTQGGLLLVVAALWVLFGAVAPGFLSSFNRFALGRDIAIFTVIGFAQMVVLSMGAMNLAVGAIGGGVAIFGGWLMQVVGLPAPLAVVLALLLGAAMGWFDGWLVVRTGMSSFIVTLAMASVYTGLMIIITQAQAFSNLPLDFLNFGQGSVASLSPLVILTLIVMVGLVLLYRNTELGRWMLAVGASPRTAELSGIPVWRTLQIGHALSGLLAGIAGLMLTARLASAVPSIGTDWVLPSFLAPVLGGTLLSGGVVSSIGTLLGGVLVVSISNGLQLMQVNSFWVQFFQGIVLLIAVGIDRVRTIVAERGALVSR